MRGEVIFLVAGLAVVAALPLQEQSDLLKVILSANPEDNDVKTTSDEKPSVAPAKMEEQTTQNEVVRQQPLPQQQDPPQVQDTSQQQPQPQDTEIKPNEEPSLYHVSEDEASAEIKPEPQPILVYPREENLSYESEESDTDEVNPDLDMGTIPVEPVYEHIIVQPGGEPPLDTFVYELRMKTPSFNQEEEPFVLDPEQSQGEPLPNDSNEEPLSLEPKIDSSPFEPEELLMKPDSAPSQEDSLPYDLAEPFIPSKHTEEFLETFHEHLPHLMEERPNDPYEYDIGLHTQDDNADHNRWFYGEQDPPYYSYEPHQNYDYAAYTEEDHPDYDYEESTEENQPDEEEGMTIVHEDGPLEKPYHESQDDRMMIDFTQYFPYSYSPSSMDQDNSPYVATDHNEFQVLDQTAHEEELSPEVSEDTVDSDDTFPEDEDVVVVRETMEPVLYEETKDATGDVSFADFYIPENDTPGFANIPQEYPDDGNPEDESEELISHKEENYSVDDGLFYVEPAMKTYQVQVEEDQPDTRTFGGNILFPENLSSSDERSMILWPGKNDEDQTEYQEEDIPVTIFESQPTYITDVENEETYPSLLEILKKEIEDEFSEPWDDPESSMVDGIPNFDAEDDTKLPWERDYSSYGSDNDATKIILLRDTRENFDNFPFTSPLDEHMVTQKRRAPITSYTDQHTRPYWLPQRIPVQHFPKIYFSMTDELPRRRMPAFFDHMDDGMPFSRSFSQRSLKTPVTRDSFTLLNEIMDDDLPPQYLASPTTSRRLRYMGPDTLSSPRNYPDTFRTPKLSFRDMLQYLNPSFYDDTYTNNIARQNSPPYYPQSYNSMQQYDDIPQQFSYTSPPVPYSASFDSFQERDYSPVQNYFASRPQTLSVYTSNSEPSSLFREDTMPRMYSHQPLRQFDDYTDDLPFTSRDSFSSSRPRFPFYQRPQYSDNSLTYKSPPYSANSFYDMGHYHPTQLYPRYAPDYYY